MPNVEQTASGVTANGNKGTGLLQPDNLCRILDAGPDCYDRYTLVVCHDDDDMSYEMYGADENPFHPLGFGQYCGPYIS